MLNCADSGGRKTEKDLRQQDPAKETVSSVKPSQHQSKDMTDTAYQHLSRDFKRLERENNDLRQDIRLLDRENREQSLDLRDLKKQITLLQDVKRQNAQLQDAYRVRGEMTENQKEQIRKEMEKLVEQLHQKDDLNLHLRQELQKRKNHMDSLTIQTREANEEKVNLEFANQKLARQNRLLSENLTECKDDLLRLQPPSQISDSEVSEQYLNLHQQISRWVDDETEDSQLLEQRFESLSMNNKDFPESLRKYLESDHLRIAKKYPNAQLYVLRRIIQRYLDDCILSDEIHLFGLDPNMIDLLKGMEQGMRRLEPRRGTIDALFTLCD